jgi:hypothetical protein
VVRIGIISPELQKLVVKSAEPAFFEPATAVERTTARSTFSASCDPPRADAVSGAPTRAVPASFDKSFHLTSFDPFDYTQLMSGAFAARESRLRSMTYRMGL